MPAGASYSRLIMYGLRAAHQKVNIHYGSEVPSVAKKNGRKLTTTDLQKHIEKEDAKPFPCTYVTRCTSIRVTQSKRMKMTGIQ